VILQLVRHPDSPSRSVERIAVETTREASGRLTLRYVASGAIANLLVPRLEASERTDNLWKTTCFEAFVRPGDGPGYLEFNMSPSTRWAAYRFDAYREGMADLDIPAPVLRIARSETELVLEAAFELGDVAGEGAWRLAITAVIEDLTGGISYWSLHHPADHPEFHHPDGFVHPLPSPEPA
jgi:hypothetical protein